MQTVTKTLSVILLLVGGVGVAEADVVSDLVSRRDTSGFVLLEFRSEGDRPVLNATLSMNVTENRVEPSSTGMLVVQAIGGSGPPPDEGDLVAADAKPTFISVDQGEAVLDLTTFLRGTLSEQVWVAISSEGLPFVNPATLGESAELRMRRAPLPHSVISRTSAKSGARTSSGRERETPTQKTSTRIAIQPNPFNPRTVFEVQTLASDVIEIEVYSAAGRRVWSAVHDVATAGTHRTSWDGTDERGAKLASGVYYAVVKGRLWRENTKVALIR